MLPAGDDDEKDKVVAPIDQGADAECGNDRRCRIARLAEKNRARRYKKVFEEEQEVERLIERRQERRRESMPRADKPWLPAFVASNAYGPGLYGSYAVMPEVRLEFTSHWPDDSIHEEIDGTTVDGNHDYSLYQFGAAYMFSTDAIAPYVRGSFGVASGTFDSWGDDSGTTSAETTWHMLTLGAGLDVQLDMGFHSRIGLSYSELIFNQARIDAGEYADEARDAMNEDFFPLDFELLLGFAF